MCAPITLLPIPEYLPINLSLLDKATEEATSKTGQGMVTTPTEARARVRDKATPTTNKEIKAHALLDSGSLAGDFISQHTLTLLGGIGREYISPEPLRVCSGLDNACYDSTHVVDVLVSFIECNIKHTFILTCRISLKGQVNLIIGRESIKQNGLAKLLPRFFFNPEDTSHIHKCLPCTPTHGDKPNRQTHLATIPCACAISAPAAALTNGPHSGLLPTTMLKTDNLRLLQPTRKVHFNDNPLEAAAVLATPPATKDTRFQTWGTVATVLKQTEQLSEAELIYTDEIDNDKKDMFAPFREPIKSTDELTDEEFLAKIKIEGSEDLQNKIKSLCIKYKDIFSDKLKSKPANIPPFELTIDKSKWETYRNRGPVRVQTQPKQVEIHKQVQEMLANGIIEKSQATYYSQVMLTPKPDGSYRFCADYRNMNDATPDASWPIPNIAQLLTRIGAQRANVFGVMDLTWGYHQAPLHHATKVLTAFITFAGVYQFTRLPFGPKRAPSYFQEQMASVVLAGLIYLICEMYLDDCIVFATGDEQFLERLETVFKRFKKRNIFLKASKCKFGLPIVEYVGRTISKEGLSMSTKKINSVLDFPKPTVNTQLRSFLGLANYFKDFVPNHSNVVSPLFKMIDHSATKQTSLKWTKEGDAAFKTIQQLIADSPTLHFIHPTAPIVLMTDASDYGIGGYLYQVVDNIKQLVALVSKALTSTQLAWSVIQKEAYAIFFCCTHLDAMLRDRKFTILTDHKNLTFIKQASNPMIVRWHLALQELDFDIQFVAGVDNEIADAMSRLCINNKPPKTNEYILASIDTPYVISNENYLMIGYVHNGVMGHGGVERTLKKLETLKQVWPNMRLDVKTYIRDCACCQKMSQIKIPINAYKYTTSTYRPMECINIDFIGPYPDKGYVLNFIDTFTRWVELYPVPEATAEYTAKCLLQHFGRYGSPTYIRSDKGSHFANSVIDKFLTATSTLHNLTLQYSSQENAIVERNNKEINRHLRALTFDKNTVDDYQLSLPFVQRILNSSYNSRTKISPADLLFGNAIDLSGGIFNSIKQQETNNLTLTQSSSKMLNIQNNLIKIAKSILVETDLEHKSTNSSEATVFLKDSFVLVQQRSAPETRLHTLWRGPMRVLNSTRGEYTLLDLTTNKEKKYHVTQMKQFHFDPMRTDPSDVARKDYLEFFIETILTHRGDTKRLSTLEFKVKWLSYNESHNSWEPWANLREMEILHLYLIQKNLRQLIPSKFQQNYIQ